MKDKIVIFGGTGNIGRNIIDSIYKEYKVIIATRQKNPEKTYFRDKDVEFFTYSENLESYKAVIDGSKYLINLSGASIAGKRWSDEYKKVIYDSRVKTTRNIVNAIKDIENKPEKLINASAIGIYSDYENKEITETSPTGNDYLSIVCKDWEAEALKAKQYGVKVNCLRVGIVLDSEEGALPELIKPLKLFAGTYLGNGKQFMSWIHIKDVVKIYTQCIINDYPSIINVVSNQPVTNKEFTKQAAIIINRPVFFGVPEFMIRIITGEFSKFLLMSQKVIPQVLNNEYYKFEFDNLNNALKDLLLK